MASESSNSGHNKSFLTMDPKVPSNLSDRQLLEVIWSKMVVIDSMNVTLKDFIGRIDKVEETVVEIKNQVQELETGLSFIETETEELKQKVNNLAESTIKNEDMTCMKKELIDLSNRSRRKNIVFHNVPEGAEGKNGCLKYVTDFLKNELEMDPPPQIEVAHRSGQKSSDENSENKHMRLIHATCIYRPDRNRILETAVKKLKGKEIFITDDLHPYTRDIHNKLVPIMKDMRKKNWLAFIPWSVPRVIKYRNTPRGTPGRIKIYKLTEDFTAK